MKHEVLGVNPTPVGVYSNPSHSKDKEVLLKVMRSRKPSYQEAGVKRYGDDSCLIAEEAKLSDFGNWLAVSAKHFATQVLGHEINTDLMVTSSWLNETEVRGEQSPHMHINALVSGTYYVKRKNCHSPILFFRPELMAWPTKPTISLNMAKQTSFNSPAAINPKEGDLLLWSSEVLHGYPPSSAAGRVSFSMNFMPEEISHIYGFKVQSKQR